MLWENIFALNAYTNGIKTEILPPLFVPRTKKAEERERERESLGTRLKKGRRVPLPAVIRPFKPEPVHRPELMYKSTDV